MVRLSLLMAERLIFMGMRRSKTEYTFLTVSGVKYIAYFFRMFYIQLLLMFGHTLAPLNIKEL